MDFSSKHNRWIDWKWQQATACKDFDTLNDWAEAAGFSLDQKPEQFEKLISAYRMGITPYYFSLIRRFDHTDPVYRQIIPSLDELTVLPEEVDDPIGDNDPGRGSRPLKALIHRYPNRVLLLPTAMCAVYCRFCFRKRLVGDTAHNAREDDLQQAYEYIEQHREIEEVILTGGDPLTLGDKALGNLLQKLEGIEHVRLIRIHTRLPVVNPFRLTAELGNMIANLSKPVWISSHFNHPQEISTEAKALIKGWIDLGIPFVNQSVLLKGVNDSAHILKSLFMALVEIKIRPYYLHHADLVQGTGHLRLPISHGLEILKELQGEIPGYAMPHYVLDSPKGIGKVPLQNPFNHDQKIADK